MKEFIYIFIMALIFTGCKPQLNTGLPDGWLPMPEEQIKSYFPVKEGDTVVYISENSETMSFHCYGKSYNYHPYYYKPDDDGENGEISGFVPYDECKASVDFTSTSENSRGNTMSLSCTVKIYANRLMLIISGGTVEADTNYGGGVIRLEFENDDSKDRGMGYPKYPNEFMQYLTDEIQLPDSNGNTAAVLKSGKGLIWFTDYTGVKWYLQE